MLEPVIAQRAPYVIQAGPGKVAWCACGRSANQPFCDGAHAREDTSLVPVIEELPEQRTYAFCGCKRTGQPPFCDGSHASL